MKRPGDWRQPPKAPFTGDTDKTALLFHAIMAGADHKITNLTGSTSAGPKK